MIKKVCMMRSFDVIDDPKSARTGDLSKSVQLQQKKPIVRTEILNRTKNRALVTYTLLLTQVARSYAFLMILNRITILIVWYTTL